MVREAVSPQALVDRLRNRMSGSTGKRRISHLWDINRAWNDHNLGVLTGLPTRYMGTIILANEAIVITAHPNKEPKSSSMTHEQ